MYVRMFFCLSLVHICIFKNGSAHVAERRLLANTENILQPNSYILSYLSAKLALSVSGS